MIPSVLASQIRQGIEDFLRTTFPVSSPFFKNTIENLLNDPEAFVQGSVYFYAHTEDCGKGSVFVVAR